MSFSVLSIGTSAGATSANCVIPKPSGLAVGNIMIAHCGWGNRTSPTAVTPPAGWTEIHFSASGASIAGYSAWKIATSSDVAASDFTFTIDGSGDAVNKGVIMRISGGRETTIATVSNEASTGPTSTVTVGTITPTEANSFLVFLVAAGVPTSPITVGTYAIATSNPTWTEQYDENYDSGSTAVTIAAATATRPETTATGNWTASISQSEHHASHVFAIYPQVTITKTETVTVSDTKVMGMSIVKTESVTVTDNDEETIGKYRNKDKSSSTYTNLDKS